MLDKLREVEARYEELERLLCDPDVLSQRDRVQALAKERSDLAELVAAYRDYRKAQEEIAEAREILDTGDDDLGELAEEQLESATARAAALEERLRVLLLPKDPNDARDVILEIRAGTGGEEAALFAADLFRMYSRFAERHGLALEVLSMNPSQAGGVKEVVASISGRGAYSQLKYESGVHRVQRVPETESQGRIHTSTATVAVLPEAEAVDVDLQDKDLKIDVMRAGGPGGQSVNTTDSAVRITHIPSGLVVVCQDEKSQHKNKAKALRILRSRLLEQERARQQAERSEARRAQVGTGERSEKIRTYNFPQDRVTDHRIGLTRHNLQGLLDGDLDDIIEAVRTHYQAEALRAGGVAAGA